MLGISEAVRSPEVGCDAAPDASIMRAHLAWMFGDCRAYDDAKIEIAWTTPGSRDLNACEIFDIADIDAAVELAVARNATPGQNLYFGATAKDPDMAPFGRTKDADAYAAPCVWIDCDNPGDYERVRARYMELECPPNAVVVTGTIPAMRFQCWWKLTEPLTDMDRLRRVLKAAQATFGSDAAVTNTGRVMRLAGGIAWPVKDGRVLEQTQWRAYPDRPVYPIERLERAFGCADLSLVERVTQGPAVAPKVDDARGAISRALSVEVLLQRIRAGQEWHNNMIRLVAHQIGCGRSDAEILAMAAGLTLPGYTVEQTEREMRQAIEGGRRKWDKPNVEKQFDPETREILEEGAAPNAAQSIPLPVLNPANWQGQTLPVRRFLVPGLVPLGAVTLLSGDGGTGKSYLALQLATSAVCGEKWLNMPVKSGPALVLACEDDADELHLRLHDITSAIGHRFDELVGMRIVSGVGLDATIFEADEGVSKGRLTARYKEIEKEARDLRPVVIVLDTAADIFAANENSRRIVRQFIGALTGLAIEFKCAIILLAHPSKAGMANGDVYSGSTAWNTSVRSRLSLQYAEKRKSDDGEDSAVDRDGRVLKHPKTNRGARLDDMKLRWQGGVFVRTDAPAGPIDRMAADAEADRRFLDYLGRLTAQGGSVTEHKSPSYAPALMAKRFADDGARKPDLERAMHRLLNAQKIRIEKDGPPSKRRKRLVLVGGSE